MKLQNSFGNMIDKQRQQPQQTTASANVSKRKNSGLKFNKLDSGYYGSLTQYHCDDTTQQTTGI